MYYPLWFDGIMCLVLLIALFVLITRSKIPKTQFLFIVLIAFVAVCLLGFAPPLEVVGTDRPSYAYMFSHADAYIKSGFKDFGFAYYLKFCDLLTGSVTGGFVISALIYVFGTIYFYKKSSPDIYLYMVLLSFLSLGFTNHHYNVIRSGLCIALLLIAFSKDQKKSLSIIFAFIAITLHSSGLLIVGGYLLTIWLKNTKILYYFWAMMLIALLAGVFDSFEQYYSFFSSLEDNRLDMYLSGNDRDYQVGLRLDFIAYSLFPIIVGGYYIFKIKYKDEYYIHIYNLYLFCNGCWLIISKMPSNDRMAYLSWVFIPFLLLYPIVSDSSNRIQNKKLLIVFFILVISGVNLFLKYLR